MSSSRKNNQQDMRHLPNSYWQKRLDAQVYKVTRCSATEAPYTGKYWNKHDPGMYRCSNCQAPLFDSHNKFNSQTGWPSFTAAQPGAVETRIDSTHGMVRDEIICKHCGAHLGHVFDDGPGAEGKRFCVNSAALDFEEQQSK